jgi:CheY-like chemotaxis protein
VAAAGGREALTLLRIAAGQQRPFRLAITDGHMPEMDGFELVRQIRGIPELSGSVILMLTSGERAGDLAYAKQLGIAARLMKPVRRADLRAAILRTVGDQAEPAPAPVSRPELAATPMRVLLAEDNTINQRVARCILERAGHQVSIATNGAEAVALWQSHPFDLILMDVQMPEMDGFEATAAIRRRESADGSHIPIVALTAHAMDGYREKCTAGGMDDYITKPIHGPSLLALLERLKTPVHADKNQFSHRYAQMHTDKNS